MNPTPKRILEICIADPTWRAELVRGLEKTLLPWEGLPKANPSDKTMFCRKNLIGQIVARGQKTQRDMDEADASLEEQGFRVLEDPDLDVE